MFRYNFFLWSLDGASYYIIVLFFVPSSFPLNFVFLLNESFLHQHFLVEVIYAVEL